MTIGIRCKECGKIMTRLPNSVVCLNAACAQAGQLMEGKPLVVMTMEEYQLRCKVYLERVKEIFQIYGCQFSISKWHMTSHHLKCISAQNALEHLLRTWPEKRSE